MFIQIDRKDNVPSKISINCIVDYLERREYTLGDAGLDELCSFISHILNTSWGTTTVGGDSTKCILINDRGMEDINLYFYQNFLWFGTQKEFIHFVKTGEFGDE